MLQPSDFTEHADVKQCLSALQNQFGSQYDELLVSDTLDAAGHQYVNLVQKGGGVLGIALVGYTFVLEAVGIRFLRLAGTSAGAINTAMLAAIGEDADPKGSAKSTRVLGYLCRLNFFDLVDGHPFARWAIRMFITNKSFAGTVKTGLKALLFFVLVSLLLDGVFLGLSHRYDGAVPAAQVSFVLTGGLLTVLCALVFYGRYLLHRLHNRGYGINPGTYFYNWIAAMFEENGVRSVSDLQAKVAAPVEGLWVRKASQSTQMLEGDVTFIASELASQNKIEFPKMCSLFRKDPDELHPAQFVRASMAIPLFFESLLIPDVPVHDPAVQQAWDTIFGVAPGCIPATARFVDGGVLSNFPVNIFYNPRVTEPRLPTFGIDLDDSAPQDPSLPDAPAWGLGGYASHLLNTLRGYYDKDFLLKNKVFRRGIGTIRLQEYNWLNFFLSDQDKVTMFVKGAQAAQAFLTTFDWPAYQDARSNLPNALGSPAPRPHASA